MTVARVVFKNKSGWRTGKHAFIKAESLGKIEEYAKKQARGREYAVQEQDAGNAAHFEPYALAI